MQKTIDCNGSNSNTTSITTTITVDNKESDDNETMHFTNSPTSTAMTTRVSVLINEPPNVLRQRLQGQVENNLSCSSSTSSICTSTTPTTLKNIEIKRYEEIEVAEYLGSNVQQMAVTPSSSPRSSPAKLSQDNINAKKIVTDIFGDSTTSSSTTNSSNSSVLTTPILCRSDDKTSSTCLRNSNATCNATTFEIDGSCDILQRRRSKGQMPPKTLPLPLKTTSLSAFHEFELSTPYTPTSSSTSLSTTPTPQSISSTAQTSAIPSPIKNISSAEAQLLHWNDMPQYLQFNPYVLNGYRPLQTFKGCLLSLFYWHNETINILTHGKFELKIV